jgi:hypothetical protein
MSGNPPNKKKNKHLSKNKYLPEVPAKENGKEMAGQELEDLACIVFDLQERVRKYEQFVQENGWQAKFLTKLPYLFYTANTYGILYTLKDLATSMSVFKFFGILITTPILFVLIAAAVLFSTGQLKEKNLVKLFKLSLRLNISGLKPLFNKKYEKNIK